MAHKTLEHGLGHLAAAVNAQTRPTALHVAFVDLPFPEPIRRLSSSPSLVRRGFRSSLSRTDKAVVLVAEPRAEGIRGTRDLIDEVLPTPITALVSRGRIHIPRPPIGTPNP